MTVKQNIDAGKYLPNLPYAGDAPKIGDYRQLAIAKVEVYPPGYDPFSDKNKVKVKPSYEYYLDVLTVTGPTKYRLSLTDRKQGDDLLVAENHRIMLEVFRDLSKEYGLDYNPKCSNLFEMAWAERLKGLHAVLNRYEELHTLIA